MNTFVVIVDFSWPRATLLEMKKKAKSLVVLDHHQTAQAEAEFAAARGMTAVAHAGDLDHLRAHVGKGRPMIVAWAMGKGRYHDVVVVGFDDDRRRVIVHDPARGAARSVDRDTFDRRWAGAGYWTLLVAPSGP